MEQQYITLISSDGFEIVINLQAALISGTLKSMLYNNSNFKFKESLSKKIKLPEINSNLLEKICEYLYYNLKYKDFNGDVPEFDIPPEIALELLVAADYLDGKY